MRQLTDDQKVYLDKCIKRHQKDVRFLTTYEDLTPDEWAKLEEMNDTEILWQEVNRYLSDKALERLYS